MDSMIYLKVISEGGRHMQKAEAEGENEGCPEVYIMLMGFSNPCQVQCVPQNKWFIELI